MDHRYLDQLKRAGAEVIKYHRPYWSGLGRMNNRTHRKLLVIDGHIGFTGGVGIAEEWTGDAQDPQHWRDTHFRVEGPVVAHMQSVFMDKLDQGERQRAARARVFSGDRETCR